jgi:hypothetical protein
VNVFKSTVQNRTNIRGNCHICFLAVEPGGCAIVQVYRPGGQSNVRTDFLQIKILPICPFPNSIRVPEWSSLRHTFGLP